MSEFQTIIVFTDGGAKPNPGKAGCGVIVNTGNNIIRSSKPLGIKTNNEAEYHGFIHAIELLEKEGIRNRLIEFRSDSQLTVKQLGGEWKINVQRLQTLRDEFFFLLEALQCYATFVYIPREENKMADQLAREAIKMNV